MSNENLSVAPRLLSIKEAAELCGSISHWTLRKHIAWGTVEVTRLGRRVFLRSEEIERIRREGLPSLQAKNRVGNSLSNGLESVGGN